MNKLTSSTILVFFLVSGSVFAGPFDNLNIKLKIPTKLVLRPILLLQPDLVVTELRVTGAVTVRTDGFQEIPVRAVIENQGNGISPKFMISARYITSQGNFMRPLTVGGQGSQWKPTTMASLYPDETVTVEGVLVGHPSSSGETVDIYLIADSCDGEELMPSYCRVNENDETNNESEHIPVNLP